MQDFTTQLYHLGSSNSSQIILCSNRKFYC